ncbi:unnamed protein product [Camellia sinensis]
MTRPRPPPPAVVPSYYGPISKGPPSFGSAALQGVPHFPSAGSPPPPQVGPSIYNDFRSYEPFSAPPQGMPTPSGSSPLQHHLTPAWSMELLKFGVSGRRSSYMSKSMYLKLYLHHHMMLWRTHQSLTIVVHATKFMSTIMGFKLIIIGDTRISMLNVAYATTCFLRRPHERIIGVRSMAITGCICMAVKLHNGRMIMGKNCFFVSSFVAFFDKALGLKEARNGYNSPYHDWLFRGSQCLMWVTILLISNCNNWFAILCNQILCFWWVMKPLLGIPFLQTAFSSQAGFGDLLPMKLKPFGDLLPMALNSGLSWQVRKLGCFQGKELGFWKPKTMRYYQG